MLEHNKRWANQSQSLKKQLDQTWLSLLPSMEQTQRELDLFTSSANADLDTYRERFRQASVKKHNFDKLLKACPKVI